MSIFIEKIKDNVDNWRKNGYKGVKKETLNILHYNKTEDGEKTIYKYLRKPQFEAFETYIYLKEIENNKNILDIFKESFKDEKEMILSLGYTKEEAFDLVGDEKKIKKILKEKFGEIDYANYLFALTMGTGKTILMAVMMTYDFILSFKYSDDKRFAKNAFIFAPDKTIIESLKEIKNFDYSLIIPKEYEDILLNVKFHYLEDTKTELALIGNYNVVVSNSQKIILKTQHKVNERQQLLNNQKFSENKEIENKRLQAIKQLENLIIFIDEAHHSYGKSLEDKIKKTRLTIEHIANNTHLVSTINLTGTPYIKKGEMIADTVFFYGLKSGVEDGILKTVSIKSYSYPKSKEFLESVVDNFLEKYKGKEKHLNGHLPKIAFYASNIDDLQNNLRPELEKILLKNKIKLDSVLEFHTKAENNKEEFNNLNSIESKKQFILLIGKGTEGWNCPSLVATAMFKDVSSSILVLQASTRSLRAFGDNSLEASIFLSIKNKNVLDNELKKHFDIDIEDLTGTATKTFEHTIKVLKKKKIKIKRITREIEVISDADVKKIKINQKDFKSKKYEIIFSESNIGFEDGEVIISDNKTNGKNIKNDLNYYEILEIISRKTHLKFFDIKSILEVNKIDSLGLEKTVNKNIGFIYFVIENILSQIFKYKIKETILEEEVELANEKLFPFKINVNKQHNDLIVFKDNNKEEKFGFHINPYDFDSGSEKELFNYLKNELKSGEKIKDIYFTGSTMKPRNEFYFEYFNPEEDKEISLYYPDFLVETSKGRYLIIEVKGGDKKLEYEAQKKRYKKDTKTEISNSIFAKELGIKEFQRLNQNFDYHIIFDTSDEVEKEKVLKLIKK